MNKRIVLDIGSSPYTYTVHITSQNTSIPDRGVAPNLNIPNDRSTWGNKCFSMNSRSFVEQVHKSSMPRHWDLKIVVALEAAAEAIEGLTRFADPESDGVDCSAKRTHLLQLLPLILRSRIAQKCNDFGGRRECGYHKV
nr:hypothetical protein Iba_chr05cCG3690 [Ipomoea batatas]